MKGAPNDKSGTVATGGTQQIVFVANRARVWLFLQNLDSGNMYFNIAGKEATGDQGDILLLPGGSYESPANYCSVMEVSVLSASSGAKFTAMEG